MSIESNNPLTLSVTWQGQNPAELLTQVGEWLERWGQKAQAMTYYEAALLVDPTYSLAAFRGGDLALRQQQYAYAVEKLECALRLTPDHAPTHYLTSLAYAGLGQMERALALAERALQYNPHHSGAILQKLRSLAALGRWEEIHSLCQKLPSHLLEAREIYLWHALATTHLGNLETARVLYDKISPRVRKRYSEAVRQIEARIGRW